MSTEDQKLIKDFIEYFELNGVKYPKLSNPPKTGSIPLPNGCHLYWKETEQGREYFSDEIGGGVHVWHTALVDQSTLLAAIVKEIEFQTLERHIKEQQEHINGR